MLYRDSTLSGRKISAIGFGGMRFRDIENRDECCQTLQTAVASGITYFDTAPGYCSGKSEERFGEGLQGKPVIISTKSDEPGAGSLRRDLERSLKRLRRDSIDVFHIWYVLSLDEYERRKKGGAVKAALKARDEGLIGKVFISTHMDGESIVRVIREGLFSGITLGLSAINAPFRLDAVEAARKHGMTVICMNPLGGGVIPKNPRVFSFLRGARDRSIVEAALRYVLSVKGVATALVGFADEREVRQGVAAIEPFVPWTKTRMRTVHRHIDRKWDRLCTGCNYCKGCPVHIQIPKLMLTYNLKVLGEQLKTLQTSMKWDWNLPMAHAARCTACGACESRCTQKLPIIERLKYLAGLRDWAS